MSFSTRLKEVLKEKGMTQTDLAKVTNLSKSAISEWLSGKYEPKQDKIYLIAEKLSVSPSWLFGVSDIKEIKPTILEVYNQLEEPRQEYVYSVAEQQLEDQNKVIQLSDYIEEDLYGYASAGTGQHVFDNPIESIRLHKSDVPTQHYDITLKVVGDSMEPAFKDGEYIFIKKTDRLRNGQFGVFIINGESYLKKVYVEDDHLRLVSLNDKYDDLIFTADDGITLVGQVVL